MAKNMLLYRMLILNGVGVTFLTWAYSIGYVHKVYERDASHTTVLIGLLFLIGLISSLRRTFRINKVIELWRNGNFPMDYKYGGIDRKNKIEYLQLETKNMFIEVVCVWLVTIGLIGNALGFFMALDGVGLDTFTGGNTGKFAGQLASGMGVAFGSTLAGSITALWMAVNYYIIDHAVKLFKVEVELGR